MANDRPRIASPLTLAGTTLALLAALSGVYGAAHLSTRVVDDTTPSALNTAYLEAWLRSQPTDPVYLKALGEQYLGLGRIDDAQAVARRLAALGTPEEHRAADYLDLRCELLRTFAARPDSPERAAHTAKAQALLGAMIPETRDATRLQWLAKQALAVNAPGIAARYSERLIAVDPERRLHWQREAARQYLATGAYREAAAGYFAAQAIATTPADARRNFIAAVRALQAGNLLDAALAQGDAHLGALAGDRATLEVMLELARAANRPELVQRYARALMPFVTQSEPEAGKIRLAAAHVTAAAPAGRAPQQAKWRRLPGIERFERVRSDRAFQALIETGFEADPASARPVRLLRVSAPAPAAAGAQPADDQLALTLYQSFLEANDLANAETVAARQAQRAGAAPEWRKRLAQVQEWHNEPMAALQSWLAYAKATDDPEAWRNVQRIAPMLNDDDAYVQSLVHASDAAPANLALVDDVIAAYERLGRPNDGLAFLKARANGARTEEMLRRYAWLSQRNGNYDDALATYQKLQQAAPRNTDYAERSANLLYQRGDYVDALNALKRAEPYAGDADTLYWRTYSQLARLLQDDADTDRAYRHLLTNPATESDDFVTMNFFYAPYPIDAARTATRQFRKTGEVQALRDALNYYVAAHALDETGKLLASLTPEQLASAARDAGFLAARAEYERQTGRLDAALADLRRAVSMPGTSTETIAAYLWMVVDAGTEDELRAALKRWRDNSLDDEMLWGPYAAGEMQLNRPEAALAYLRRQAVTSGNDPLWLLTYADAQDMAGRTALAWSMRRRVWLALLHEESAGGREAGEKKRLVLPARSEWEAKQQLRGRRALLAQLLESGDTAAHLLNALTNTDTRAPDDASSRSLLGNAAGVDPLPAPQERDAQYQKLQRSVARDVAVAWALSLERNDVAKRWLSRRYATDLSSQRNEQLTIALAEENAQQVTQILDTRSASLTLYTRIDAENFVDRQGAAQAHAFAGLDGAPYDDQLHERLVDTSLFWDQSIGTSIESYIEHPLDYVQQTVSASLKLTDHYLTGLLGIQRWLRSADTTQLVNVDSVDRQASFFVRRQTNDSTVNASFGRRDGLDSFYTFRLDGSTGNGSPLTLSGSIARNADADETQTLFVGGMKDLVTGSLLWQFDPRWSLNASLEADRFYSQARNLVGTGSVQQAEVDYKIRTEYPDYTLRFVAAHGGYNDSGTPDALLARIVPASDGPLSAATFMPNSYTQFGAYVGFGNDLAERYTHAWRPYLDLGIVHDTVQGWGLNADIGIAGSVFGGDHAAIYFEHEHLAQNGSELTMIGARYRWLY